MLDSTAGQPSEMACRTRPLGEKPSWVAVSFTTPCSTSSMSKVTFERGSARQAAAGPIGGAVTGRAGW